MSLTIPGATPTPAANGAANDASRTSDLGQADFLLLLTEQLKNQDPLKPLESNQFLAQLAQFSTVQGIQGLNTNFETLAANLSNDQALQGAALIGHDALVAADGFALPEGGTIHGAIDSPMAGRVTIDVQDAAGNVVRQINVNAPAQGPVDWAWDGLLESGEPAPAGEYRLSARVSAGSNTEAVTPHIAARVNSVYFTNSGLVLDLAGIGSVPFSAIRRISG